MGDHNTMIDDVYEFSAPRFFDFIIGETKEEMQTAENWFDSAICYAPSPFMPRIKEGRSIQIESLCDFGDVGNTSMVEGSSVKNENDDSVKAVSQVEESSSSNNVVAVKEEEKSVAVTETTISRLSSEVVGGTETRKETNVLQQEETVRISVTQEISIAKKPEESGSQCNKEIKSVARKTWESNEVCRTTVKIVSPVEGPEACTPKPQIISKKSDQLLTGVKKSQTAKKIASLIRNPSSWRPKTVSQLSQCKSVKPLGTRSATVPDFVQENQAIKRQKLEEGKSRQILNVKPQILPHNKSRLGLTSGTTTCGSSISKTRKEDRKLYVREGVAPFISTAEMVRRFQSCTRGVELPQRNCSINENVNSAFQKKTKLTLTRPKEPEFETSHRARSTKIKSSAELEEEMMANMPKFKARPVNKKILEAPTLPALPRSTPQLPEFQEFHLKTMERADQHAETSSVVSTESSRQVGSWNPPNKLTEPKMPRLETLLRARPTTVKTSLEIEEEELEKIPKFKARPLDKRIFESKGGVGMFRIPKGHVTRPQEFHFATDERIPPAKSVFDLFDKLSLNSEPRYNPQIPRTTTPNPFHLNTEERGAEKERRLEMELRQKQLEEERARVPKATPYPYTTDYPVVPPKPEPKHCTKPEPFQLESLVRHEEEMQREMEERQRLEKEEAQKRIFKAQPILKEDPLPLPEKERKPLTRVEEFPLHVDHRAVDRAQFDKKIKEKEMMYKRYRDEHESAKMVEEEKAVKQLRRTLVPHARPVPSFANPFLPQKSLKETTKAKSPKLRVLERRQQQRRTSSAATNMR
ncbi:hypothetical protein ACHQM5_003269 [Ranunculus cassubicifolius]